MVLWKPLVNPTDLRGFGEVRLMPSGHKCHKHDFSNATAGKVLSVYCLMRAEQQQTSIGGLICGRTTNQFTLKLKPHGNYAKQKKEKIPKLV